MKYSFHSYLSASCIQNLQSLDLNWSSQFYLWLSFSVSEKPFSTCHLSAGDLSAVFFSAVIFTAVLFSTLNCHLLNCHLLSCHLLSCPLLDCPLLNCPLLDCPLLNCPLLSYFSFSQIHWFCVCVVNDCVEKEFVLLQ